MNKIDYLYNGFIKVFKRNNKDVVQTRDSVAAVVFHLIKQRYIFVKQYRPGSDTSMLEIPAGGIDKHEEAIDAIMREVQEETGYRVFKTNIKPLKVPFYVSPGYSTEKMQLFYVQITGDQRETDGEVESIVELTLDEVITSYNKGELIDMKTIFALSSIRVL